MNVRYIALSSYLEREKKKTTSISSYTG